MIGRHDCKLCGILVGDNEIDLANKTAFVCDDCTLAVASNAADVSEKKQFTHADEALDWHFAGIARTSWPQPRGSFPDTCAPTCKPRSTDCSRNRRSASSASTSDSRYETLTISALTRYGR